MFQDLNCEKNDEIDGIKKKWIKSGISREVSIFFKKIDYSKEILAFCFSEKQLIISSRYVCLIMLFPYLLCIYIFLKIFVDNIYLSNNCLDK